MSVYLSPSLKTLTLEATIGKNQNNKTKNVSLTILREKQNLCGEERSPRTRFLWPCPSQPGTVPKLQDSVQGTESHQSGESERSGSTRSWQNQPSDSVRQSGALTHTHLGTLPDQCALTLPPLRQSFRELEDKSRWPNLCSKLSFWKSLTQRKMLRVPHPVIRSPAGQSGLSPQPVFAPRLWVGLGAGKDCPCLPQDSHPARLGESHCSA